MDKLTKQERVVDLLKSIESGDSKPIEYIDAEKFTQHNLTAADGIAGFGEMMKSLANAPEKPTVKTLRAFTDGDYVFAHSEYNLFGEKVGFDIFRFEGDMIVEHWDNLQPKPTELNPSGRTMTDGATEKGDSDKTEANRELVKRFATEILIERNYRNIINYFEGDNYIQHNPKIGDGLGNFGAIMSEWSKAGILMQFDKIHKILADGNFVLMVSEGLFGDNGGVPTSYYDMFRIEDGKIAEHWDVIEPIIAEDERKNLNGKFNFKE